jgi:predicted ribosome quality control (RQC) complex YloA/Tae2 family protein
MSSVTYNENGNAVTVPLDIRLTPIQNAQRYFEKARKARLARGQSGGRLNDLRSQLAAVQRLLAEAGEITTTEEMKRYMEERSEELTEFGIGKKAEEREQLPFRIFTVDGGFEVWAGKSSRNNDELTMKHAKPNDLWFHARGSSGSHVILKTGSGNGEPGKKAREQAAAIAAYYSKMKNAKMVPVAMTERKYVRKPKGSPPGSVVLDREKVIFAEPALPEESGKRKGDRQ